MWFQRTERAPKDRNVAETDPQKFADMLIERLAKVYEEQENMRRMEETINSIEVCIRCYSNQSITMETNHKHGYIIKSSV